MTTPVVDKTHIPSKTWRRHTDPPSLWIFAAISSVSLHLLIFWLMRSSNVYGLWFPQESQAVVPVELIEISSSAKSTTVSPKPKQSVSTSAPKTAPTTPKNQDADATIVKKQDVVSQAQTKPSIRKTVPQPKSTATTTPKPSFTPESTKSTASPTPRPQIPVGNLPWNRRQEIVLGKGKPLPNGIPSAPPTDNNQPNSTRNAPPSPRTTTPSTPSSENPKTSASDNSNLPTGNASQNQTESDNSNLPTGNASQNQTANTSPTPTGNTPQLPSQNNPNTSEQTGSVATITPLADAEVRQLSQDLPDVLATYQGSSTKELETTFIPGDAGLAPAQLIASLVIDRNGNFQQAVVIQIEPMRLESEKVSYQQAVNEMFRNEQFTAAYNRDGSKPELSNLFVRIVIGPVSSN